MTSDVLPLLHVPTKTMRRLVGSQLFVSQTTSLPEDCNKHDRTIYERQQRQATTKGRIHMLFCLFGGCFLGEGGVTLL